MDEMDEEWFEYSGLAIEEERDQQSGRGSTSGCEFVVLVSLGMILMGAIAAFVLSILISS